jgi:hypothetical protein
MKRFYKIFKYTMIILISTTAFLSLVTIIYLQQPQFGQAASGERLERMKKSKHYRDGAFANLSYTPSFNRRLFNDRGDVQFLF